MIKQMWNNFKYQEFLYGIIHKKSMFFIEQPDYEIENFPAKIRLFWNKNSAEEYRESLIERDFSKPSQLQVEKVFIKDIFEMKDELESLANQIYESSLQVVVCSIKDFEIIFECILYDSLEIMN